jgi:hypothetical protein
MSMELRRMAITFLPLLCMAWLGLGLSSELAGPGQESLDYLTEQEVEHVRDAQPIEMRVKVFMKIAERRLLLAEDPQASQTKKDEADWGPLPKGSRADMLKQYGRAIEETITNFEDAYDRNPKDERLLKGLTTFCEFTAKHLQRLEALRTNLTDEATRQILEQTLDDLKLAYDDARQSQEQFKLEQEQQKQEQQKQEQQKQEQQKQEQQKKEKKKG